MKWRANAAFGSPVPKTLSFSNSSLDSHLMLFHLSVDFLR